MSDDETKTEEDAARDEHGERLPVDVDKRSGMGTLRDIVFACAQQSVDRQARLEREREEIERHRAACTAETCATCRRIRCYRCDGIFVGHGLCRACSDAEAYERAKRRVYASVPKRFMWATERDAGNLLQRRIDLPASKLTNAIRWAEELSLTPPSIVLVGRTSAGKTSLAIALFAVWFEKHRDEGARFASAIELGLARQRHPLGHDEAPLVQAAIDAPLLILDDMGAEAARDADVIRAVLHARHNADVPTWITTGLSRQDLASRYDAGVARRMFEDVKNVEIGQ